MRVPENGDHPIIWMRWHCDVAVECAKIAVIVVEPDRTRELGLRNYAREIGGVFSTCPRVRSAKQFLQLVAGSLGVACSNLSSYELFDGIEKLLSDSVIPLFLDRADLLTSVPLEMVLDIVKSSRTGCVLSSGSRKLLERIERVDQEGSFISYCSFYCPDVEPTPKLRDWWSSASAAGAPPTLKFPGTPGSGTGAGPKDSTTQ